MHGRYGQPCPVCGAAVQRIVYAENEANYCARCQTEGRLLADRALSRLLKATGRARSRSWKSGGRIADGRTRGLAIGLRVGNSNMRKTVRFEELNTADLLAGGFDTVILPIGSCESHGDHLPFGIDAMIAHDLALTVAARVKRTMVLPPIWYGMSRHYRHQPMEVSVSNDTNIAVYRDVLEFDHSLGLQEDPGDQWP